MIVLIFLINLKQKQLNAKEKTVIFCLFSTLVDFHWCLLEVDGFCGWDWKMVEFI
jgi:hypothetical protein